MAERERKFQQKFIVFISRGFFGAFFSSPVLCYNAPTRNYLITTSTAMEILEKIFGSAAKVKLLRLFLFNTNQTFDVATIALRAKVSPQVVRNEMRGLEEIGLVKAKTVHKAAGGAVAKAAKKAKKKGKKHATPKIKAKGWVLNENFLYLGALKAFLINVSAFQPDDIIKKMSRVGKIKLLVVSGVFLQEKESRVDLLVVGDGIKKGALETAVKMIEAELGREIVYSAFETVDFQYRISMFDKLVRDILDFPHKKLVDKLNVA